MGCCGSSEEFQPVSKRDIENKRFSNVHLGNSQITEEEKNERRIKAAQAAEIRSKNFAQVVII